MFKRNVVISDKFDQREWKQVKKLEEQLEEVTEPLPEDLFYTFFKYEPRLEDDARIWPEYLLHKVIIEKMMRTEDYHRLRMITQMNRINSAVAVMEVWKTVIDELVRRKKELSKVQEDLKKKVDQLLANAQNQAERASPQAKIQIRQQLRQQIKQLQKHARKKLCKAVSQAGISTVMRQARTVTEEFDQAVQTMRGWGLEESSLVRGRPAAEMELAKILMENKKVLELAKMLGRLKSLLASVRRSEVRATSRIIDDVEMSDNIGKVLPQELFTLSQKETEDVFLKKYLDRQLMCYAERPVGRKEEGDFVVCVDLSGSMEGEPEIWAKAIAMVVVDVATKKHRKTVVIAFDTQVKDVVYFDKRDIKKLIRVASIKAKGDTRYEPPLLTAFSEMDFQKLRSPDILFITDSLCDIGQDFLEKIVADKKKTGARIISVLIGQEDTGVLRKFSDTVVSHTNLMKASREVFRVTPRR